MKEILTYGLDRYPVIPKKGEMTEYRNADLD